MVLSVTKRPSRMPFTRSISPRRKNTDHCVAENEITDRTGTRTWVSPSPTAAVVSLTKANLPNDKVVSQGQMTSMR